MSLPRPPTYESVLSRMTPVQCPLCNQRKARRACPALGQLICAVCCGTKRLTEIACPPQCGYLATARSHPPAAAVRQQQVVAIRVSHFIRDLNDQQARLFLTLNAFFAAQEGDGLQSVIDDDVAEAVEALAGTYETAARGVIYEHQPTSRTAERLVRAQKPLMIEARKGFESSFESEAAVVLRRIAESVRELQRVESQNRRAYLDLARTVVRLTDDAGQAGEFDSGSVPFDAPRLIVP
jgi:hypothetical protein